MPAGVLAPPLSLPPIPALGLSFCLSLLFDVEVGGGGEVMGDEPVPLEVGTLLGGDAVGALPLDTGRGLPEVLPGGFLGLTSGPGELGYVLTQREQSG